MNNYISLSSLALDLKRVALMYNRGSEKAGERFLKEVMLRKAEIDMQNVKPYIAMYLSKLSALETNSNLKEAAEDALLYSIIFQNASLQLKKTLLY